MVGRLHMHDTCDEWSHVTYATYQGFYLILLRNIIHVHILILLMCDYFVEQLLETLLVFQIRCNNHCSKHQTEYMYGSSGVCNRPKQTLHTRYTIVALHVLDTKLYLRAQTFKAVILWNHKCTIQLQHKNYVDNTRPGFVFFGKNKYFSVCLFGINWLHYSIDCTKVVCMHVIK